MTPWLQKKEKRRCCCCCYFCWNEVFDPSFSLPLSRSLCSFPDKTHRQRVSLSLSLVPFSKTRVRIEQIAYCSQNRDKSSGSKAQRSTFLPVRLQLGTECYFFNLSEKLQLARHAARGTARVLRWDGMRHNIYKWTCRTQDSPFKRKIHIVKCSSLANHLVRSLFGLLENQKNLLRWWYKVSR